MAFACGVCAVLTVCSGPTAIAAAATSRILVSNISVPEGDSGTTPATFTVRLSKPSDMSVTVHYMTVDGTAHAPEDYVAQEADLTIPAMSDGVPVTILVKGDKIFEADEAFRLEIQGQPGTGDKRAKATIANDETPPTPHPVAMLTPAPSATTKNMSDAHATSGTADGHGGSASSSPATRPNITPSTARPTISAVTRFGAKRGPPGAGLALRGTGWHGCEEVSLVLGKAAMGSQRAGLDGSLVSDGLSVPGDAKVGATAVTATCVSSGRLLSASSPFDVIYAADHRTAFVASFNNQSNIPLRAKDVATNLLPVLVLILVLGFITELFNSTVEENHDEIRSWFGLGRKRLMSASATRRGVTFALLVVLGGVMCAFVSPDVGFDRASLALVIGMSIALVIVTVGFDVPKSIVMRRRFRERGQITALPATIVIAAGCVLASRMLHFRPGLLFGLLAVLTFRREFESRLEGKLAAVACAAILAVSIGAWVAVGPVGAAARSSSSFWLLALEATLSAICVIGLETVTFVLLPVKFMMGSTIMRWSKTTWFVLFVLSGGLYVRILIRPGIGAIGRSSALPSSVVVLAVIPCLISVLFWAYFRFRSDRPTTEPISDEDDADQFAFTDRATTLTA